MKSGVTAGLEGVSGRRPAAPGGGAIVPVSGVSWVPYAVDRPFHGRVMRLDASPVPLDPGVSVRPGRVVGLGWFCRKELWPGNRVWFDGSTVDTRRPPGHVARPHRRRGRGAGRAGVRADA